MKKILTPVIILALMAAFAFVCFFVFITRGRDSWLKRKLRLGAMILSFSAIASCCGGTEYCYTGVSPAMYPCSLTDSQTTVYTNHIELDIYATNTIYWTYNIGNSADHDLSYTLSNTGNTSVISNSLDLVTFPESGSDPRFALPIDDSISPGRYSLMFHQHMTNGYSYPIGEYTLDIMDN